MSINTSINQTRLLNIFWGSLLIQLIAVLLHVLIHRPENPLYGLSFNPFTLILYISHASLYFCFGRLCKFPNGPLVTKTIYEEPSVLGYLLDILFEILMIVIFATIVPFILFISPNLLSEEHSFLSLFIAFALSCIFFTVIGYYSENKQPETSKTI
jgi:hypothetical protein